MKNKIIKGAICLILLIIALFLAFILINTLPVNKSDKKVKEIVIESGTSLIGISEQLEKEKIIRNAKIFYYYTKIKKANNIYAATYSLSSNMKMSEVLEVLLSGGKNTNTTYITFKEGLNMRGIAKVIEENTNNSYQDVMDKLKDEDYITSLIKEYWFLDDSIKNKDIYYPLEGYLFPETYNIEKDAKVEDIFKCMLDQTDIILTKYKKEIEKSNYSIHEIITLSSIVQLEGYKEDDFKKVASTFLNRLNKGYDLGSCVTSYYGAKNDMETDLTMQEINDPNPYNTRAANMAGRLPIGPISNPSEEALKAVLTPIETDYLYFVSDKDNNLYFTKTLDEHNKTIESLQEKGLWYEW